VLLEAPPGLVDEDELPPLVPDEEPPDMPPPLEDEPPDMPPDDEPPEDEPLMPLLLPVPPGAELELDEPPGELGAEDEDDDEPPGTTTVSFSLVVLLLEPEEGAVLLPPGTTVVVSFFSQALSARAAATATAIKYPLRFMSTPFSFCGYKVHPRVSKCCAVKAFLS
jgi:hypothetical protein